MNSKHWFIIVSLVLLISNPKITNADPDLFTKDASGNIIPLSDITDNSPLLSSQPVLFVHGHIRNYQATWLDTVNGFTSFGDVLSANTHLEITPYFINFQNNTQSIVEDAVEIGQAVDIILGRHNSDYNPENPDTITQQLVVISYSKGTISTRLYLKSLYPPEGEPFPAVLGGSSMLSNHGPNFQPISEFIAISPPNHGLKQLVTSSSALSIKQLNNGYGIFCQPLNDNAATDFIAELNGHAMQDTNANAAPIAQDYPSEAPGSRSIDQSSSDGVLYVTIYSEQNRDLVGGDDPSEVKYPYLSNCPNTEGRKLAKNLAPDAENISINAEKIPILGSNIPGSNELVVHRNTVHACEVIYRALYTASHHRTPASVQADVCISENSVPEIPQPYLVWYGIFIDWWKWLWLHLL